MTNNCGIYKITNTITGDFYIGSSCNIGKRLHTHRRALFNNTHHSLHLQRAWNKYGEQAFDFTILLLCNIENKLHFEQGFLNLFRPTYNMAKDVAAPMQGRPCSEEAKCKISKAHTGKVLSAEHKRKISKTKQGRHYTEETKHKMSEAHMGKTMSDETRRKIGNANAGEQNYMFGQHMSEEAKHKLSEAKKGHTYALGYKHTDEARTKISESKQGKHPSEETKHKISEALKRYQAEKKAVEVSPCNSH